MRQGDGRRFAYLDVEEMRNLNHARGWFGKEGRALALLTVALLDVEVGPSKAEVPARETLSPGRSKGTHLMSKLHLRSYTFFLPNTSFFRVHKASTIPA